MQVDWDSLGRWGTVFSILSGVVLLFTGLRWVARRAAGGRVGRLMSWALVGNDDDRVLISTTGDALRLLIAAAIWAIIGAAVGAAVTAVALSLIPGIRSQAGGTAIALTQNVAWGALIGAVFRSVAWPLAMVIRKYVESRRGDYSKRRDEFLQQRRRVESRINRGRN